jgi:hypothetical protein
MKAEARSLKQAARKILHVEKSDLPPDPFRKKRPKKIKASHC